MNKKFDSVNCTNVKWVGRAHCEKCHIRQVMFFSELPHEAFDDILHQISSVLYEAGSDKNFIYSIRHGLVKLIHISRNGSYKIVRLLGPGTAIGLELLDGASNYHHTATTISEVDLCKIAVSTVENIGNQYPRLIRKVSKRLQNQLDIADQLIIAGHWHCKTTHSSSSTNAR
ncbi:MAG: cyclic nucleotide-binding domain-containing protein [Gammaproteobacteria bacterium]|nr:cyclic nucleotide-binding domain-containing protein [Gammaproteobacteria bacterium]